MPVTPFHFGPGALLHVAAPKRISFWAFCGANVLMDIEPLYYILTEQARLHRFFHTYIGATLITLATTALFLAALNIARRMRLPNIFDWRALTPRSILFGAALGAYTHIVLDSVMHGDITPLAPFSNANHLLDLIPLDWLHLLCVASAILAVCILYLRANRKDSRVG